MLLHDGTGKGKERSVVEGHSGGAGRAHPRMKKLRLWLDTETPATAAASGGLVTALQQAVTLPEEVDLHGAILALASMHASLIAFVPPALGRAGMRKVW